MHKFGSVAALLCAAALSACSYDKNAVQDITAASVPASRIRFFHVGVNAPGVNFYADATKMTAITSATGAESTTGVVYGSVASGGNYSVITPGSHVLTGKIAAATDKDVSIAPVTVTIEDGKFYSYYLSGIYDAVNKKVDAFVVDDPWTEPTDFNQATVRFVNAISNAQPMTMYAKNTTTGVEVAIGGAIPYKSGSAFIALPGGVYDVSTRNTGSATNVITGAAFSFSGGHVYTVSATGDITVTGTTAATRPILRNIGNR